MDIVLVYKVDRLSRSLADFARLMQVFDEHRVSFVSVTQQFNTTNSMGRLTLNMLLSFAQFEREVAGERSRDKIAATKKRGVWVCGRPPIGYQVDPDGGDRRLVIVPEEARVVRAVFEGYMKSGSLLALVQRLNAKGFTTRRWTSSRDRAHGGRPMTTHFVYRMLTNPVYAGMITHTPRGASSAIRAGNALSKEVQAIATEVYPGLHEPIIDRGVWDAVHAKMRRIERVTTWTHTHFLKGKIRTEDGYALSPGSVLNRGAGGAPHRVGYYVSQKAIKQGYRTCEIKSINAAYLDNLVRGMSLDHLRGRYGVDLAGMDPAGRDHALRELILRAVLSTSSLVVELCDDAVAALTAGPRSADASTPHAGIPTCRYQPSVQQHQGRTTLTLRILIKKHRHGGRRVLLSPDGHDLLASIDAEGKPKANPRLVAAVGQAFALRGLLLQTGETVEQAAPRMGISATWARGLLDLVGLSPGLLKGVLTGTLAPEITLADLRAAARHLDWSLQEAALRRS